MHDKKCEKKNGIEKEVASRWQKWGVHHRVVGSQGVYILSLSLSPSCAVITQYYMRRYDGDVTLRGSCVVRGASGRAN